ncbi:MAG: hypothetical protein KBA03_04645 [Anaerolineaceae bacterium]|nr:hypothetical protein [Anaerolineaceae bacterium]
MEVNTTRLSNTHLRLLGYFSKPRSISLASVGGWGAAWFSFLGRSPQDAINFFISNGLLKEANEREKVSFNFTVLKIKELLIKNNIKPRGNKADLVQLVVNHIPIGKLSEFFQYQDIYICTEEGKVICSDYLEREPIILKDAFDLSFSYLKSKNISAAAHAYLNYQSIYAWPNPFNPYNNAEIIEKKLNKIIENQIGKNYDSSTATFELARGLWDQHLRKLPLLYGSPDILTQTYQAAVDDHNQLPGYYKGRYFLDYVEIVKQQKREGKYIEAIENLIGIIQVLEDCTDRPPPWYCKQAGIVYRKLMEADPVSARGFLPILIKHGVINELEE